MRTNLLCPALVIGSLTILGCAALGAEAESTGLDVCALLKAEEVNSIQGTPYKDTQALQEVEGPLAISQCLFALPNLADSISVRVVQKGMGPAARDPREVWRETFHTDQSRGGKTRKGGPPQAIKGIGDEAFWLIKAKGAATLHVLKGSRYLSITVGGQSDLASRLKKSRDVARIVLKRLP